MDLRLPPGCVALARRNPLHSPHPVRATAGGGAARPRQPAPCTEAVHCVCWRGGRAGCRVGAGIRRAGRVRIREARPGPSATDARARALPMLRARKCNAHARPRVGPVRAAPAHACAQPWPRTALGAAFAGMRQGAVPKSGRSSVTACACTWAACVSMRICARGRVHVRALHVHAWKIASRHPAFRRVCE